MVLGLSTDLLIQVSLAVIALAAAVILISLAIIIVRGRKTTEEAQATRIIKRLDQLRNGKKKPEKKLEIKKHETSLKDMLTKRFKPRIEAQLSSRVDVLDFNAKGETFLALVDISGIKLLLTLDKAGKIIDYKKVKK